MNDIYDLAILGAGTATMVPASQVSKAGWRVAVTDFRPFGGTCALRAQLVGPHVDEVINVFALAVRHGLTATHLKKTMFVYPTGASDIGDML